jgi:hypothetical protein
MPKFTVLKDGINEALIAQTNQKVEYYMGQLFHEHEFVKIEGKYTFTFGTISVSVEIFPWHTEDCIVKVYSYLAEGVSLSPSNAQTLLNFNVNIPFGAFGVTFEDQAVFSYSLAGANLDLNEFQAAVQMVAKTADEYDEVIKNGELLPK